MLWKFRLWLKWKILSLLDRWGIRYASVFELLKPVWPMKKSKAKIYYFKFVYEEKNDDTLKH